MHAAVLDGLLNDPGRAVALLRQHFARATELVKGNGADDEAHGAGETGGWGGGD
jgi:hypothetical protein